ncbi:hypothetical protein HK100_009930, partial [Physocladia obscura]
MEYIDTFDQVQGDEVAETDTEGDGSEDEEIELINHPNSFYLRWRSEFLQKILLEKQSY